LFSFSHSCVFKLFFHSILFLQTHKYIPKDTDNLVLGFGGSQVVASHLQAAVILSSMQQTGKKQLPLHQHLQRTLIVHFGAMLPLSFASTALLARLGCFKI
jgi:hypothetical protein